MIASDTWRSKVVVLKRRGERGNFSVSGDLFVSSTNQTTHLPTLCSRLFKNPLDPRKACSACGSGLRTRTCLHYWRAKRMTLSSDRGTSGAFGKVRPRAFPKSRHTVYRPSLSALLVTYVAFPVLVMYAVLLQPLHTAQTHCRGPITRTPIPHTTHIPRRLTRDVNHFSCTNRSRGQPEPVPKRPGAQVRHQVRAFPRSLERKRADEFPGRERDAQQQGACWVRGWFVVRQENWGEVGFG
jgi:hypothetical protein